MKTITMDYIEYKQELDSFYFQGYKKGCLRMVAVMEAFNAKDFKEAHCILMEDMEQQGHESFLKLSEGNTEAEAWLKKEGF